MNRVFFVFVFVSLVSVGSPFAEPSPPHFAIYRMDLPEDPPRDPCFLPQEYLLSAAVMNEPPILTEEHIVDFCWDTQRVTLTDEGARRWIAQGGYQVPLTGLPLLVTVEGEPRYAAMLWNPLSSRGCLLPTIWCMALDNRLSIGGMFISAEGDTTLGANYDPEAKRVLSELGKLVDPCPE